MYGPGDPRTPLIHFMPDDATFAFNKGDLIHPGWFADLVTKGTVLRIVNIEHIIWAAEPGKPEGMRHKLCIFTEEVADTAEMRLRK
jgi:hypothetical protein